MTNPNDFQQALAAKICRACYGSITDLYVDRIVTVLAAEGVVDPAYIAVLTKDMESYRAECIETMERKAEQRLDLEQQLANLRGSGSRLEHALDATECATMTPDEIAADTKAVGGPISNYCVDYDEEAVVKRVKDTIADLRAKLLGTEECLETWKSAAEKWEAEVTKLDADLATLHTKVAEAAMIVDRYWTFDDNQQHTHTWHDKQDALAALRSRIKDV